MGFLLWIVAVVLVIWGVIALINGSILFGILLVIAGCAIGPGGWTVYDRR